MHYNVTEFVRPANIAVVIEKGHRDQLEAALRYFSMLWGGNFCSIAEIELSNSVEGKIMRSEVAALERHLDIFIPDLVVCATAKLIGSLPELNCDVHEAGFFENPKTWESVPGVRITSMIPPRGTKIVAASSEADLFTLAAYGGIPQGIEIRDYLLRHSLSLELIDDFAGGDAYCGYDALSYLGCRNLSRGFNHDPGALPVMLFIDSSSVHDVVLSWNIRALNDMVAICSVTKNGTMTDSWFEKTLINAISTPLFGASPTIEYTEAALVALPSVPVEISKRLANCQTLNGEIGIDEAQELVLRNGLNKTVVFETIKNHDGGFDDKLLTIPVTEAKVVDGDNNPACNWVSVFRVSDNDPMADTAMAWPMGLCGNTHHPTRYHSSVGQLLVRGQQGFEFQVSRCTPQISIKVPSRLEMAKAFFKSHEIHANCSQAGQIAEALIRRVGGLAACDIFDEATILGLNEMATSERKSLVAAAFEQRFKGSGSEPKWEQLVERGVAEVGLDIKCTKCAGVAWFQLDNLGTVLKCQACLEQFSFPKLSVRDRKRVNWSYRVVGPFAAPDYARGSYTVAKTLKFLGLDFEAIGDRNITWTAGLDLLDANAKKLEVDFLMLHENTSRFKGLSSQPELILGECKSYGPNAFQLADFQKMAALGRRFLGSTLVFSALKRRDQFSHSEQQTLRSLISWSKEPADTPIMQNANIMVLTGDEFFEATSLCVRGSLDELHMQAGLAGTKRKSTMTKLTDVLQARQKWM